MADLLYSLGGTIGQTYSNG